MTYDTCLKEGYFPSRWKQQRLVLLLKGNNHQRNHHLTVHSACSIRQERRNTVWWPPLDIRNAFNSTNRDYIMRALEEKNIPKYLCKEVARYFTKRVLKYDTEKGPKEYKITGGRKRSSTLSAEELKEEERQNSTCRWQLQWDAAKKGRRTHRLIPQIDVWLNRNHGEVNYYLTQMLSGHGCFRAYFHRFKRFNDSPECPSCPENQKTWNTCFSRPPWVVRTRRAMAASAREMRPTERDSDTADVDPCRCSDYDDNDRDRNGGKGILKFLRTPL
ncbi:hypothetical protein EVAR_79716_1 [Eumeta japonica]|uniref:Reverse transcriptase domain-containing protein n=1 Tax=Eumeta variegata TaxID=151549 RepID=A0A4C1TC93_EUMVA|nr:hypothetical protein EVAR_79716_1 [Eumeta japonica]